jgi:hypothetical protein
VNNKSPSAELGLLGYGNALAHPHQQLEQIFRTLTNRRLVPDVGVVAAKIPGEVELAVGLQFRSLGGPIT